MERKRQQQRQLIHAKNKNSWRSVDEQNAGDPTANTNAETSPFSIQQEQRSMETDLDHFSFNDTMYHNLARSLSLLGSITCAEISFGNAKSWKQRLHIGFVFFCCCWSFLGYVINYMLFLTSKKDLCDVGIIVPGWNYIRRVRIPGFTEQQQHFAWLEGVVWLLPLLAFYSRPKEKAASVRKVMNVKVAHRLSYVGNENPRNRLCNIDIDEAVDERGGRNPLVTKQCQGAILAWTISLICTGLSAGWFNGPGFHERPPLVWEEYFDVLFILVVTFFAFATFSYCAVLFRLTVYNHHFEVKQLTESIQAGNLKETRKIVRIDKQIHRGIKATGEMLGMYMLLMTIGVALIILSTIVTVIVYLELHNGTVIPEMDSLPNNNTAASAAGLGNCIPEIDGKQTDTSVRPGFFILRRVFFCLLCCAPFSWCLYGAGNLGTRFTYLIREILNADFEHSNSMEGLIYLNSHFQMRKLAKESGLVMFGILVDMDFLCASFSIFFSVCAVIAGFVSSAN
tara:strand:- start:289 stop:1818 length:1530 start_codon:yes stop_codon:yes gene_type:complete